jgi:hypothetical protein
LKLVEIIVNGVDAEMLVHGERGEPDADAIEVAKKINKEWSAAGTANRLCAWRSFDAHRCLPDKAVIGCFLEHKPIAAERKMCVAFPWRAALPGERSTGSKPCGGTLPRRGHKEKGWKPFVRQAQ